MVSYALNVSHIVRKGVVMSEIGTVYKSIATESLKRWHPEINEEERDELLQGSFEKIEQRIRIEGFIEVAAISIGHSLKKFRLVLPDNFLDIVLHSQDPKCDLGKIIKQIKKIGIHDDKKARVAISAISEVHRRWVNNNKKNFFDPARSEKRFMFLPLKFIGFDEAAKDYVFVKPILDLIGFGVEQQSVRKAYEVYQSTAEWTYLRDTIGYELKYYALSQPEIARIEKQVRRVNDL